MKILIIGGTVFLGRTLAALALTRGHELTLFHRGKTNPHLFPEAEHLLGDRDGGLAMLGDSRRWDAVIDTSGYVPRVVAASADALAGRTDLYIFISSISVFDDVSRSGIDENAATGTLDDETTEEVDGKTYGPLKALCERAVQDRFPGRALIIRPGLIVGPHDPTDRFTYWPVRVAAGGNVLAPGRPEDPVQVIDVRDLSSWILDLAEAQTTGVFNATSPRGWLTMGDVLETSRQVAGSEVEFHWVPTPFLLEQGVGTWVELPLWLPDDPAYGGFMEIDVSRAVAAGLTFRPIADTIEDTLVWDRTRTGETFKNTLTRDREKAVLEAWYNREG